MDSEKRANQKRAATAKWVKTQSYRDYCINYRKTERYRLAQKKYALSDKHKETRSKYTKSQSSSAVQHRHQLKRAYGMTEKDYEKLYKIQNAVCAICGRVNLNGVRLSVDHDHESGKIRGLLCNHCNAVIGQCRENILNLYKAADYLERHRPPTCSFNKVPA